MSRPRGEFPRALRLPRMPRILRGGMACSLGDRLVPPRFAARGCRLTKLHPPGTPNEADIPELRADRAWHALNSDSHRVPLSTSRMAMAFSGMLWCTPWAQFSRALWMTAKMETTFGP